LSVYELLAELLLREFGIISAQSIFFITMLSLARATAAFVAQIIWRLFPR
jgi:hypothetical protein